MPNLSYHTLLAVDSACGPCSAALQAGGNILAYAREEQNSKQSSLLVPMVESVMKQAGLSYRDVDAIVSTVGPGSFTGLRIGLAAAIGIGFAAQRPVHGATTLATLAYAGRLAQEGADSVAAVLNAGKGEVYCQPFGTRPFAPLAAPLLCSPEALPKDIALIREAPDARALALLAYHHPTLLCAPEPLYIRPPDAKPMAS